MEVITATSPVMGQSLSFVGVFNFWSRAKKPLQKGAVNKVGFLSGRSWAYVIRLCDAPPFLLGFVNWCWQFQKWFLLGTIFGRSTAPFLIGLVKVCLLNSLRDQMMPYGLYILCDHG